MSEKKRTDDQEMSMEEILASIRRYVADDTPETNNQEGGVDYTTGKTADVIRLTEALDTNNATLETEHQTEKTDLNAASLQPKEVETEKKISSPAAQKSEQTYSHNPKLKPFVSLDESAQPAQQPVAPEPAQQKQHITPQPTQQQYTTQQQQYTPHQQQYTAPQQPAQQQYTTQQQHDPLQTYGEQVAQPRSYQGQHMHQQQPPQTQQANHHYGQNSMDYSRQPHHPNAAQTHVKPSIVSEPTMHSTESAFSKLTQAFQFAHNEKKQAEEQSAVYGTSAIESFVIEMARPMIREWVDQHLPKLVDKLVTQEIEKLTEDLRKKLL